MIRRLLLATAGGIALAGCVHAAGGVAPSSIPIEPGSYRVLGPTSGRDCIYHLFGVIPITGGNTVRTALAHAISHSPGADALVGVTADTYSQYFIVFSRVCTQVQGTGVALH